MNPATGKILFSSLILCLFILPQCSKTKGIPQESKGTEVCDTPETVSYSADVAPILNESCGTTNGGCHGYGTYAPYLGSHSAVIMQVPDGVLMHSIQQDQPANYTPMPLGANKLSDCKIAKIKKWIDKGAQDN
ncbi:MAG: hypothetical protein ACJ76F_09975 [Bacteroidia bacterium]